MPEAKATILGAGAMGTALGLLFAENGFKTVFWDIDESVVEGLKLHRKNPRSFPDLKFPKNVTAERDIQKAIFGSDVVLVVVATKAMREVLKKAAPAIAPNCAVIIASKGLEEESFKTMIEVALEELSQSFEHQLAVLSGPTFAADVAAKKPTAAMLASYKSNAYFKRAAAALTTSWFKVSETRDVAGVEYAGVSKHALAIAAGIMTGLDYADNTRAWVITEGFRDMARLVWKLGGREETVYGLAGLGDALGTLMATQSRNRTFGELLGKGKSPEKAADKIGSTIEGAVNVDILYKLSQKEKLNLPVLKAVHDVVVEHKKAETVFKGLLENLA